MYIGSSEGNIVPFPTLGETADVDLRLLFTSVTRRNISLQPGDAARGKQWTALLWQVNNRSRNIGEATYI